MNQTTIHPFEPCIDSNSNKLYNEKGADQFAAELVNLMMKAVANPCSNLENCSHVCGDVSSEEEERMPRTKNTILSNMNQTANTDPHLLNMLRSLLMEQNTPCVPTKVKKTPSFSEYAETWLELYKRPKLKPTTLLCIEGYLRNHLLPFFGEMHVDEITTPDIQRFLNAKSHLSRKTLSDMLMWLSQILDYAREDGYLMQNPATSRHLSISSTKQTVRKALNEADLMDVISNLDRLRPHDRLLIALALFTGSRRGELMGLKYSDIDDQQGVIHIRRNIIYPGQNRPLISTPKSKAGFRDIPILSHLKPYLPERRDDAFIFCSEYSEQKPYSNQQIHNTMNRISSTINLHGATLHCLRHTFVTEAIASGMDIKSIATIAGHASTKMTFDRYAHPQKEQIFRACSSMDSYLKTLGNNAELLNPVKPA
ncbi:MAG: site-specific integrase [Clostridia bacterium]|nr:site-specific integrase [Clostridia bacterium]